MTLLRSLGQRWAQLRTAARREFLRAPHVVLLEREAEPAHEGVHGR